MLELLPMDFALIPIILMIAGLIMLVYGGNWTVDSAIFIAKKKGIPPMVVGFTIVAFGTSFPELVISIIANFQDLNGIALGNVIGSNIANILLVIGLTAVISPIILTKSASNMTGDLGIMIVSCILLAAFLLYGTIGYAAGTIMLLLLFGYLFFQYRAAKRGENVPIAAAEDDEDMNIGSTGKALFMLLAGLVFVSAGAKLLIDGASETASLLGVPDAIIALSIVAFGTSVPELSTCIVAARKKHSDIAIGNIIGSNVFNILMIIGITSVIKPISKGSYAPQLVSFDVWFMLSISMIFAALLYKFGKIGRNTGFLFCALYIGYNIFIFVNSMS